MRKTGTFMADTMTNWTTEMLKTYPGPFYRRIIQHWAMEAYERRLKTFACGDSPVAKVPHRHFVFLC